MDIYWIIYLPDSVNNIVIYHAWNPMPSNFILVSHLRDSNWDNVSKYDTCKHVGRLDRAFTKQLQWYTIVYSGGIRRFDGHCFILYKRSQLRDVLVPFFSTLLMWKSDECRVNANAANALPPSIARSFASVTLILPDTRVLVVHEEVTSALTMSLLSNNRQYGSSIHFVN